MPTSLTEIHDLEVREAYPSAIDRLEERLMADPTERETVLRLGFNLWYAVAEECRMRLGLPVAHYASRFMALLREYQPQMEDDADFCWAFGLGISLFWWEFPGADEALGDELLARAKALDAFYLRLDQDEMNARFRGRGIFESYFVRDEPAP